MKDPFIYHIEQMKTITPIFSFDSTKSFTEQKKGIYEKYMELIKIPAKKTRPIPIIEYEDTTNSEFDEIRFVIESEPGFFVPAHMLIPKKRKDKLPMVICLQGHSPGMHVSIAREAYPGKNPIEVEGDRDFCIQAVARGYIAVALEQRGFGELNFTGKGNACHELSCQAALMGRTLMGERIRDIIALIDAVEAGFDFVDMNRIGIMGNSGGGTSSYFAACVDERIKVSMPSSSFCTFVAAWGSIYHCSCAYVPNILNYMEMPDMAIMIAPRHLVVVNGIYDPIQPFDAAEEAYEKVKKIYKASGSPDNCAMVIGDEGHRFYADKAWDVFDSHMQG